MEKSYVLVFDDIMIKQLKKAANNGLLNKF